MDYTIEHKKNEQNDRRKSALITFLVSMLVFLAIFFYKFTKIIPQTQEITTMLINFGDNQNGNGLEEPANQEGSLASNTEVTVQEPVAEPQPTPLVKEKMITGQNVKVTAPKAEKKETVTKKTTKSTTANKTTSSSKTSKLAIAAAQAKGLPV